MAKHRLDDHRRRDADQAEDWHERAMEEQRRAGRPTTAGTGPGGAPTGLHRAEGWPDMIEEIGGEAAGGTLPVAGVGSSGVGAGGLATGPAGTGGARVMSDGADRPARRTKHASTRPNVKVDEEGKLSLQTDRPATLGQVGLDEAQGPDVGEPAESNRIRATRDGTETA